MLGITDVADLAGADRVIIDGGGSPLPPRAAQGPRPNEGP
jgi:hypothetical protein